MRISKLRKTIIDIVKDQLNRGNPPEARLAVERLMDEDPYCDYDEVVRKIAVILSEEMYEMMKN